MDQDSPLIHFLKVAAGLHERQPDQILFDQRAQNEGVEQQGMNPTRNMVKGPTHQNLRNKQYTDQLESRLPTPQPNHYATQYSGKEKGELTP